MMLILVALRVGFRPDRASRKADALPTTSLLWVGLQPDRP